MQALIEAVNARGIPDAEIVLVISDQAGALGLQRANESGIETLVIERAGRSRERHDHEIVAALRTHQVQIVCLAGYMRKLSNYFVEAFRNRILNIHPSLLPSFPGLEVHRQVLKYGVTWSGCTVHFVDESLDGGPIIAQRTVPVLDDDTEETLAERTLEQEHQLYAEALALVVSGKYRIEGRRVIRTA